MNTLVLTKTLTPVLALALDRLLGEPRRAHPLVLFGRAATAIENRLYGAENLSFVRRQCRGFVATFSLLLPVTALAHVLVNLPVAGSFFSIVLLYGCTGLQSLHEHARAVAQALHRRDLDTARNNVGWMVSRDTRDMNETQITRATIESVLENGNDAVFATLFWFFVLGAPGAVLLRATNTLDAMWGYRNARYQHFGTFAARLDDVLNFIPARLTAISFALLGNTARALFCWHTQARFCASPNGGPVMTAGAGALQITLGGGASYHGVWKHKTTIGEGRDPSASDIEHALQLVRRSAWLWVVLYALTGVLTHA